MTIDFATATPAEIDTAWNDAHTARATAIRRALYDIVTRAETSRNRAETVVNRLGLEVIEERLAQAIADAQAATEAVTARLVESYAARGEVYTRGDYQTDADRLVTRLTTTLETVRSASATIAEADAEWSNRGGWRRFYLVTSSNKGHVHNWGCGSWRWSTAVAIVVEHSGTEDLDIVAAFGETACSRCFADAPVAAAPVDDKCRPGYGETSPTRAPRYKSCDRCGYVGASTSTGKLRAHKPAKA